MATFCEKVSNSINASGNELKPPYTWGLWNEGMSKVECDLY